MNSSTDERLCDFTPGGKADYRCELEANLAILRNTPAFSGLPLERLKLYAFLCKRYRYRAGEFLFHQGDKDDRGYIIACGRAQVIREYKDHSYILSELHEGDFFGGLALLADIKRLFSVRAVTELEVVALDRESFRKILAQFPETSIKVLEVMIQRIAQMEEKLLEQHVHECTYQS